jgi:iron complex outermembrane receptor protein
MKIAATTRLSVAGLFLTGVLPAPVLAQSAAEHADSGVIEEIVVTARYRSERLGDVPDSITAFSAADIEAQRIERVNDVAALTPNLRFSDDQEVGVSTLIIRGVRQNRGTGQPPVSFRVDGVSATNNLLTTQDLFDIESIEVLRGPQGALYGRNAIGGAILVTTRQPTDEPEFGIRLSAAEGQDYTVAASASGPLSDTLKYRAAVRYQDREGQLENAYLGNALVDFKDSLSFRGRLLYTPSERLSINLTAQYADQEGGSGYFMPGSEGVIPLPPPDDPIFFGNPVYEIQSNSLGVSYVKLRELSAKVDYAVDWGVLTSITSFSDVDSENDQDLDQTLVDAINIEVDDFSETFAQEFRLASNADSDWRWVAGVYFFQQDRNRSLATTFFGTPVPAAAQDLELENVAAFGNLSYDLSDALELTVAFRYDRETPRDNTQGRERTFDDWQPKFSLAYDFAEDWLGYVTIGKGFRAGGFNNLAPGSNFQPGFDAETLWSYEAGIKGAAFNGRLRGGFALFRIDYTDQQFFLFDQTGTQANINVPESEILGGELEFSASLSESLTLDFAYGFTSSEIEEYEDIQGVLVPASAIQGSRVPGAPVWTLNLGLQHRWALNSGLELVSRVNYEHRDKTYWTLDNLDVQRAYDLVDASLTLQADRWSTRLFATNLFDEEYIEWFFGARFIGLPADIAWPSRPRQVGVEFSYDF